jgi:hypothetical protein
MSTSFSTTANHRRPLAIGLAAGAALVASAALAAYSLTTATAQATPSRTIDASKALDAGPLPGTPTDIVIAPIPADPTPLVERSQWVFDLRWDKGDVWLLGVQPMELAAPRETPRVMGRFALELYEGPALVERARFDFPLLGSYVAGDAGRASSTSPVTFAQNLRTRIGVVFPSTARGNRLELWDRATNRRWSLPWPPSPSSPTSDGASAGTPSGADAPSKPSGTPASDAGSG